MFAIRTVGWFLVIASASSPTIAADVPAPPLDRPGWTLTFHDEFDGPKLNDWYWFPAYRSGRKVHFARTGRPSRWQDSNAHYVLEDGLLKLRIDEKLPARKNKGDRCVSSIQTSDHRFGATTSEYQVLDKFAQKYGWFEVRCRIPSGSGLHSAFWLLQHDPTKQEYAPDGRRRTVGEGVVEIDVFEQLGRKTADREIDFNVHFTKTGGFKYKMDFDPSREFHVWALEWKEGELNWHLDGRLVHTYKGETPREKMFILLGLYQGAVPGWVGPTDPDMPYPRDFEIDYVRVYSRNQGATTLPAAAPARLAEAVEKAHAALWDKFIGRDGLIHDYVGELPAPEDCKLGRPNAIGWWSPIENGPMFTGSYLVAACERARRSGSQADRDKARRLAKGLLACASLSDVPGFVARGMGTDGKCHYPMGSQDQTHPWFYGLHTYAASDIPDARERKLVVDKMTEVADALEAVNWQCPCDGAFKGQFRGDFKMFRHHGAAMYLFILRAMHDVTGDRVWLDRYQAAVRERSARTGKTRLEICAEGYPHDREQIKNIDRALLWIYVSSQGGLARLADWETDPAAKAQYRAGLAINARGALAVLDAYKTFDNADTKVFGHARWREGYPAWFPQKTQADAERMASTGDRNILGQRKGYEASRMRNPLAAAALIAMGGYREGFDQARQAICHYDYARLNMAEFFFAECAYYALPSD
ncbi:MAG: Beta-glucanase precursor [Planctomycetes bacterium ADurb.Bin126]|nr:MAG: Beta-glucanase precursor [Planctomycetes bacterium ADurb.Bin126]